MNSPAKDIDVYLRNVKNRLGHLPKDECSAILDNLEVQIQEALDSRCKGVIPTQEDVKAVLAEMDSPEAFDNVSSEVPGSGPRPVVGTAALYISVVGIVLSMAIAIVYSGSKANQGLSVNMVVATVWLIVNLVVPSQILALIVASFSKGDRRGRKAIFISKWCLVLWLVMLLAWIVLSTA
ncbi:MAG: hypothetical protein ACYC1M_19225 [Armatimonadota bacterium]